MNKKIINHFFNPITLVIVMIIDSILLLMVDNVSYSILFAISLAIYFISIKRINLKTLVVLGGFWIILNLAGIYGEDYYAIRSFLTLFLIMFKMTPIILIVLAVRNYSTSELLGTFRMLKFSNNLAIAVTIFFRYLPEFIRRTKEVIQGAKVRGIKFSILHPLKSFEYLVVPLLYKSIQVSDHLTGSVMTKGVEYDCQKTIYRDIRIKKQDVLLVLLMMGFLGVEIWKIIY